MTTAVPLSRRARDRFFHVFTRGHTWLLARTRGRPSHVGPRLRFLVLETTGRRSGLPRRIVLLYMPDGDAFVVLASNFGQEHPPAWWRNLTANPDAVVHVAGRSIPVRARALDGEERQAILPRVVAYNGLWRGYVQNIRRDLPVVRLEGRPPAITSPPSPPG
jgi:deazaflavin-dependent oxidoreductase (nitroreductase family)